MTPKLPFHNLPRMPTIPTNILSAKIQFVNKKLLQILPNWIDLCLPLQILLWLIFCRVKVNLNMIKKMMLKCDYSQILLYFYESDLFWFIFELNWITRMWRLLSLIHIMWLWGRFSLKFNGKVVGGFVGKENKDFKLV